MLELEEGTNMKRYHFPNLSRLLNFCHWYTEDRITKRYLNRAQLNRYHLSSTNNIKTISPNII